MKNFVKDINTYIETVSKAKADYNDTVKKNHEVYREGSPFLAELDKRAKEQYKATITQAYKLVEGVSADIAEAKAKVQSALSKPVPKSLSNLISNYEAFGDSISDKDMAILMAQSEHSLVGRRIIEMKFKKNQESMARYEDALARLDDYADIINKQVSSAYAKEDAPNMKDYSLRALLHEPTTTSEINEINGFLDSYVNEPESSGSEA